MKGIKKHNSARILVKKSQAWLRDRRQFAMDNPPRDCPICAYHGRFISLGTPPRWDGRCPNCGSRERHRLIELFLQREGIRLNDGRQILHFAPEAYFVRLMAGNSNYHGADLVPGKARHAMDMADIRFEDDRFDVLISNHVLEHVPDDKQALRECFRVIRPGGFALLTVPINWARESTYENTGLTTNAERYGHYGDISHLRYYGRDFPQRLEETGFAVRPWRLPPEEEPRYGLLRDDVLWIASKPNL